MSKALKKIPTNLFHESLSTDACCYIIRGISIDPFVHRVEACREIVNVPPQFVISRVGLVMKQERLTNMGHRASPLR